MVSSSQQLFERRGDRWDTNAPSAKDPVVAALRDIADRIKVYRRGYDAGPVRKPRYDGKAMHPQPRALEPDKPLKLIERNTFSAILEKQYRDGCGGSYERREIVLKVEPDLVKLSQEQLEARVEAGRNWVAEERARIAAERAAKR